MTGRLALNWFAQVRAWRGCAGPGCTSVLNRETVTAIVGGRTPLGRTDQGRGHAHHAERWRLALLRRGSSWNGVVGLVETVAGGQRRKWAACRVFVRTAPGIWFRVGGRGAPVPRWSRRGPRKSWRRGLASSPIRRWSRSEGTTSTFSSATPVVRLENHVNVGRARRLPAPLQLGHALGFPVTGARVAVSVRLQPKRSRCRSALAEALAVGAHSLAKTVVR